jgi:hypothetical protein
MASEFYKIGHKNWDTPRNRKAWLDRLLALKTEDDKTFGKLLAELLAWQGQRLPQFHKWLKRHGWTSWKKVEQNWEALPAVPQALYKQIELYTQELPPRYQFLTSGTTSGGAQRGSVRLLSLDIYRGVSVAGARRIGILNPATSSILALLESPARSKHSSLSWMVEFWMRELPEHKRKQSAWYVKKGELNAERLAQDLQTSAKKPILLIGTAFAWVHFLDYAQAKKLRFRLHPQTRVIETGGYKGRSRELPAEELYTSLKRTLGVQHSQIWNEYGMTELSSQSYARNHSGTHQSPPWLRLCVVDPLTFLPVPKGEEGIVKAIDLANVDWPPLLLTADRAVMVNGGIRLLGRTSLNDGGRGCSLTAENLSIQ